MDVKHPTAAFECEWKSHKKYFNRDFGARICFKKLFSMECLVISSSKFPTSLWVGGLARSAAMTVFKQQLSVCVFLQPFEQ